MRTALLSIVLALVGSQAAIAAPKKPTVDLGVLKGDAFSGPGDVLAGKVENVGPGGSFSFIAPTNQIWGLGELSVEPAGAAKVKQTLVKEKIPGVLGGATYYRYTVTLSKKTKTPVTVKSSGNFQTRNSPHWAFSFQVAPAAPDAAASNYHPIPLIPGYMGGSPVPGADDGAYHPIPLIPGYMGGSPVPGANVSRNDASRPAGSSTQQPSGHSSAGAGVAH